MHTPSHSPRVPYHERYIQERPVPGTLQVRALTKQEELSEVDGAPLVAVVAKTCRQFGQHSREVEWSVPEMCSFSGSVPVIGHTTPGARRKNDQHTAPELGITNPGKVVSAQQVK